MKFFSFTNPKYNVLLLICAVVAIAPSGGCASAVHKRKLADGSVDKTSIHTFFSITAIKGFSETMKDGTGTNSYSRSVKVTDAATQTEIEKLAPIIDSAVQAAVAAGIKGVNP